MIKINGIEVNNQAVPYSGEITEVNDTEVTIRITARMGILKVPLRAVLGRAVPRVGDKVTWRMSLIEMEDIREKEENQYETDDIR